ncbi:DUF3048 domain-containing protein [Candidatus Saccharibacteria bacterium]|nr:DUF3048 domain-containing protein [Candidatus Saccharibacteria bacterium]
MATKNSQLKNKKAPEVGYEEALNEMSAQPKKRVRGQQNRPKSQNGWKVMLLGGVLGCIGGAVMFVLPFVLPKEALPDLNFPLIPSQSEADNAIYSDLTGLTLNSLAEKTATAYCIQTPNGTDGARPQVGLKQAGVVFEAIAEAGITRFAAIYQNPASAVIGPIRSLRLYYLQWDTPFDCAIVHAGGADDAIEAVRYGGYLDLSENYAYMYRSYAGSRLWNNLFTTAYELKQFSADNEHEKSQIKGFSRMTPAESVRARIDATVAEKLVITKPASHNTSATAPKVTEIGIDFGGSETFNVYYNYDAITNSYARSYGNGYTHDVYVCPNEDLGEPSPENVCGLEQMSPAVVVAMYVEEHRADDNYHEDITTVGSGEAVVFQNGIAIHGRWEKASVKDQIKFYDDAGSEIKLAPGQTFVEAVPGYGNVAY